MRRILLALTLAIAAALALAATASAAPSWAPAGSATVHPGVMTFTEGGQCTSNFVFYDGANDVYIGQSAHCSSLGAANETNGCTTPSRPNGTPVEVDGASRPGTMVYNSWNAMKAANERDASTCQYNDFALVKLDPADYGKVNPSIPFWGGPTGLTDTVAGLADVLSYGNSSLRLGVEALRPKQGKQVSQNAGGWNHHVLTATPGIPGDSGSAFIDGEGRAFGTLSTLQAAPVPASNGVANVSRELDYRFAHGGPAVTLAQGTEPFEGPLP